MSPRRSPLPPRQVCPGCRREHRAFKPECPGCRTDQAGNRSELATMAREARKAREAARVAMAVGMVENAPVRPGVCLSADLDDESLRPSEPARG